MYIVCTTVDTYVYTYAYIHTYIRMYVYTCKYIRKYTRNIFTYIYVDVHVHVGPHGTAVRVRHCICITIICLLEEYRGVYIYTIQTYRWRKEEGQDRGGRHHYWY